MRIDFNISRAETNKFQDACEVAIRNVGEGTKAAAEFAGRSIMLESIKEVPVATGTLLSSAFLGVARRTDVKNYRYGAVFGYGDTRGIASQVDFGPITWILEPSNAINPNTGLPASAYATEVHEDLSMRHPNGGKAKFLEDPVRDWAAGKFARTAASYWSQAISGKDASKMSSAGLTIDSSGMIRRGDSK